VCVCVYIHNQAQVVVHLLSINGLWLVNHDVMQLSIVTDPLHPESNYRYKTKLKYHRGLVYRLLLYA